MIEWLKSWANQIIVAVIIAVIFELIIPNGKNKKYIKMVINLYVLFAILNPIISKFTNSNEIDLSKYNYEDYFSNTNSIETSSGLDSSDMIIDTTKKIINEDIKKRLLEKGYKVTSISIDINNSDSKYGQINWIKLSVVKNVESDSNVTTEENNSSIQINEVEEINVENEKEERNKTLRKSEIEKVKNIISEEYDIPKNNIEIN